MYACLCVSADVCEKCVQTCTSDLLNEPVSLVHDLHLYKHLKQGVLVVLKIQTVCAYILYESSHEGK